MCTMSLSLKKLLPEIELQIEPEKHFQARVPMSLWHEVDQIRKEKGWTYQEIAYALLKKFVHEFGEKK